MHGLIFAELKRYAAVELGDEVWPQLLEAAGLSGRLYFSQHEYEDAEAMALVQAAARLSGQPPEVVLESFGEFVAPNLLRRYARLIPGAWKTLEVLENAEQTLGLMAQMRNADARPPAVRCERAGPDAVVLRYASARGLCAVARGMVMGLARHFGESVEVREPRCMHAGARECLIRVRRVVR